MSLTQGMEGENSCYELLKECGYEIEKWGDERNSVKF